jgi:thiol-disulfide isomerase/thioredoxin
MRMSPHVLFASVVVLLAVGLARAAEPVNPDKEQQRKAADVAAEATPKVEPKPALNVSDTARPVLEKMREAYGKLAGLQTTGTWTADIDVDGETVRESAKFAGSYAAPNRFRHETEGDLLFGSTGEKIYAFKQNQFLMNDAPKARVSAGDLPTVYGTMLKEKNPSLLLAMTDDETPFLADKATNVDRGEDVSIGGTAFPSLKVSTSLEESVTVLVDPSTNLIRKWSIDLKAALEKRGQQNVKAAVLTIDYATTTPEAPAAADAFAWAPPAGAKDAARMAEGGEEDGAQQLIGKPAPDFELDALGEDGGKKVKLKDINKDHVVVLDFWATWCGPCRAGLPILDKVYQARKEKKLKVYAVNLEEDKDTVAAFVKETKLGVPVLLDRTGETSKAYLANAIPETVIIGRDGKVKHVLVGTHPQAELEKLIDEAMKE